MFQPEKLCKRASIIFNHYLANPDTIQHMILYGPPGAGKTTAAEWFVQEFWKTYPLKQEVILILNAADERSLEAIRQKMYPFAEAQAMACSLYNKPKFIILDECETLTETAQLALRPLLEYKTDELCLIFICNSLTRVQKPLMNHFLQIRFDPPLICNQRRQCLRNIKDIAEDPPVISDHRRLFPRNSEAISGDPPLISNTRTPSIKNTQTSDTDTSQDSPQTIDTIEWRNDYRKQKEISSTRSGMTRFIHYLLSPPTHTLPLLEFEYDTSRTLRWCALLAYELDVTDSEFYSAFTCLANPDLCTNAPADLLPIQNRLFSALRAKFDAILPPV